MPTKKIKKQYSWGTYLTSTTLSSSLSCSFGDVWYGYDQVLEVQGVQVYPNILKVGDKLVHSGGIAAP